MLRAAFCRTTRPWAHTITGRLTRYQSTVSSVPEEAGPSKHSGHGKAKAGPADPQSMLRKDAETNALLDKALLEALEEFENETPEQEEERVTIQGYDTSLFEFLPPTNPKYDPAKLPIDQKLNQNYREVTEEEWHATLVRGRSVQPPFHHKPVYHIPVANLHLRSHHPKLLDFFCHFASHAAASLGIPVSHTVHLPTQRSLWTVPRSPFVHKKSQENFERRTHKRAIKAWDADPAVVDRWMEYLRKHAMAGVGMRVTRWHRLPLGAGIAKVEELKQKMSTPALPADKIKTLANQIVKDKEADAQVSTPN